MVGPWLVYGAPMVGPWWGASVLCPRCFRGGSTVPPCLHGRFVVRPWSFHGGPMASPSMGACFHPGVLVARKSKNRKCTYDVYTSPAFSAANALCMICCVQRAKCSYGRYEGIGIGNRVAHPRSSCFGLLIVQARYYSRAGHVRMYVVWTSFRQGSAARQAMYGRPQGEQTDPKEAKGSQRKPKEGRRFKV